jgi:peptide/nickel transport system substrate-binding protein
LYDKIFTNIHESAYIVPLYAPYKQYGYNTRMQNVTAAPTSYEGLEWHLIDLAN